MPCPRKAVAASAAPTGAGGDVTEKLAAEAAHRIPFRESLRAASYDQSLSLFLHRSVICALTTQCPSATLPVPDGGRTHEWSREEAGLGCAGDPGGVLPRHHRAAARRDDQRAVDRGGRGER